MQVEVTGEETAVLIRWKKRADNYVLVRMKAEAILYASRGVDVSIIAEMVERSVKTIREWLAGWRDSRMCSVLTGHAGNQNAAKLTRAQKEDLKAVLAQPPSQTGVHAEFWDVPAIRDVVKILFDVEYRSDFLVPAAPAVLRHELQTARPVRQAPRRAGHHQAHGRGEGPGQGPVGRRLGGVRGRRGAPGA